MKKIFSAILCVSLLLSLTACKTSSISTGTSDSQDGAKTITVTDVSERKVEIPAKINKIATAWDDFSSAILVCGAGDKVVATANVPGAAPWLNKVSSGMTKALATFGGNFNVEDLMNNKPDVIFVYKSSGIKQKLIDSGIPTVQIMVTNFDQLKKCMTLTGEVLGGNAVKRASDYNKYFDDKINMIKKVTSTIPNDKRPKVLHVQGTVSPVVVDGVDSTIDDWITTAGGVNAAQGVSGTVKEVSMEQVVKWNPDVIVLGTSGDNGIHTNVDKIYNDPKWKDISAVKNHRVYVNPNGMYMWDRNCPEEALQIQWAAKTLYPDLFKNLDIVKETKSFYKQFFDYNLTDDDAERIIKAEPPVQ